MKRLILYFLTIQLLIVYANADPIEYVDVDGNPIPEAMDNELARLNQIQRKTDDVIRDHSRYMLVRDNNFRGANGIFVQSEKWYTEVFAWLNALSPIVDRLKPENVVELSSTDARLVLQADVNSAFANYFRLLQDASKIKASCNSALDELSVTRRYPDGYMEDYNIYVNALVGEIDKLEQSITNIKSTINNQLTTNLELTVNKTKQVSDLLVLNATLDYPDLKQQLIEVESMLLKEKIVTPLYEKLFNLSLNINSLITKRRVFSASDILEQMEKETVNAKNIVDLSTISDNDKLAADEQFEALLNKSRNTVGIAMNNPQNYTYRFYYSVTKFLPGLCKIAKYQSVYNCTLLNSLLGLDGVTIQAMTIDEAKLLEQSLINVYEGPLGG